MPETLPLFPRMRPPLKVHGGKFYLARRLVALIDELPHTDYLEPYGGGASVLLHRKPGMLEHYNDLDYRIFIVLKVIRDQPEQLAAALEPIPYDRRVWEETAFLDSAKDEELRKADPLHVAVSCLVRNRMSRGGLGNAFAWSDRLRGGRPGDANAWETFKSLIPMLAGRLRAVAMTNLPALEVIKKAGASTLIYADPPYYPETRKAKKVYRFEMSKIDHLKLLGALTKHRGPVVLSGYDCRLYSATLDTSAAWRRVEWDMPNHSGQNKVKHRRLEIAWVKGVTQ